MDEGYIITLPQFKEAMVEVLARHEPELRNTWDNKSWGEYTAVWGRKPKDGIGVYNSLAEKLGMKWWPEYWNLDAVFFKEWCEHSKGDNFAAATFLSLVIEHENYYMQSAEEINRLLAASAAMKVLVTYPGADKEQKWLDTYSAQIKVVDGIWPGHSAQQRYVVIFGDADDNGDSVWHYYAYENEKFRPF